MGVIVGAILASIYVAKNKNALRSVALGKTAANYEKDMKLVDRSERFLYKETTEVYNPPSESSGGGGRSF